MDVLYFSFSRYTLADVFEKNEKKNKTTSQYRLRELLSKGVFEHGRQPEVNPFTLLTCLDDVKFVLLNFFILKETI